jgi:hypothetical protein
MSLIGVIRYVLDRCLDQKRYIVSSYVIGKVDNEIPYKVSQD